jgi:two-component system cell cycle response regulator
MSGTPDTLDDKESGSNKQRVLMIDDSKVMRKSALKMLGGEFDVIVAEDGQEGWDILRADSTIQVCFTDLSMPRINGYELLKLVRTSEDESLRSLPVIVVTGAENDDEAKEQALQAGATDFITKPFNSTDLKARALAHANHQRTTKTLQQNANVDVLTGLPNQRALLERIEKDVSFISRHQEDISVMIVEIDSFNDLFVRIGRNGADSVIKQIAKVLEKCVRQEDTIGRTGLARFTLSLPTAKPEGVLAVAQRVCRTVESFKARLRGEPLIITVSVGIYAGIRGGRIASGTLVSNAEAALASAQKRGRSQIEIVHGTVADLLPEQGGEAVGGLLDWAFAQAVAGNATQICERVPDLAERLATLVKVLPESDRNRLLGLLGR